MCRLVGGALWVVLGFAGISRLDHKVAGPGRDGPVVHVVTFVVVRVNIIVIGHQPVLVIAYEKVGVLHTEESAGHSLTGAEPVADSFQ